jgi:hypothetical protein
MTGRDLRTSTLFSPLPPGEGPGVSIGAKRPQVDHPLPLGEGRGEGTALHVESCRGRGYSTLVTSASGSVEASPSPPSPSPRGRGVILFKDLCPRITNSHLDARLTRLTPMPGVRVMFFLGQTLKRRRCWATSPRHALTSNTMSAPSPSPGGRGRNMLANIPEAPVRTSRSVL